MYAESRFLGAVNRAVAVLLYRVNVRPNFHFWECSVLTLLTKSFIIREQWVTTVERKVLINIKESEVKTMINMRNGKAFAAVRVIVKVNILTDDIKFSSGMNSYC